MQHPELGQVLDGDGAVLEKAWAAFCEQKVDQVMQPGQDEVWPAGCTTIGGETSVSGPGTFFGKAERTLRLMPTSQPGWWFDRVDLPESLPIGVSVRNVWTTVRNIVLRSGSPHNYMRMVEHIVALKVGLGIDNVLIRLDSGDPPLFDRSSMDLVEAFDRAGRVTTERTATWVAVREPVTLVRPNGSFLCILPPADGRRRLEVDCAIDFPNAIGRQRIQFAVSPSTFRYGAFARTNTNLWMMLYCKTIGKLFADTRNLGYSLRNILVAGPRRYVNRPRLLHEGKALEAAWHRATLDLLAAVALIDRGRLAGRILSYRAGHALDCDMVRELYRRDLLEVV